MKMADISDGDGGHEGLLAKMTDGVADVVVDSGDGRHNASKYNSDGRHYGC